ncbi:hypothetical protein QVD17_19651 [Tagetes erecta]|uniref:CCHC-type domain-containing protein n=1 Tax=Tagetes erecta TaxID=13708 RepID=A0AAD8NXE2_TARER|nr:hypothetical protein QVD17_19651 [Tagetes erecta]
MECRGIVKCDKCRKSGHMAKDCWVGNGGDKPKTATGAFNMTRKEARNEPEVISGMDWLSKFNANIGCRERLVCLKAPDGSPVTMYGNQESKVPRVISILKANRVIQQGCNSFLAYVKDVEEKPNQLSDVPIVCNFPDVFPEDFPGTPPDREIEFQIDLVPGAQPWRKHRID